MCKCDVKHGKQSIQRKTCQIEHSVNHPHFLSLRSNYSSVMKNTSFSLWGVAVSTGVVASTGVVSFECFDPLLSKAFPLFIEGEAWGKCLVCSSTISHIMHIMLQSLAPPSIVQHWCEIASKPLLLLFSG